MGGCQQWAVRGKRKQSLQSRGMWWGHRDGMETAGACV